MPRERTPDLSLFLDIYEMMVFHYLGLDADTSAGFDESFVDREAVALGAEVRALWERAKAAALAEAQTGQ